MRYLIFLLFIIYTGCKNEDEVKEPIPDIVEYAIPDTILAWNVDAEAMMMKRDSTVPDSIITISRIINGLNEKYPQVQVRMLKQEGDTLYVEIPDATFLGEQMGSAGATDWFADAVINLTTVPGINYVYFQMDIHSHAQSGIISRKKYDHWKRL